MRKFLLPLVLCLAVGNVSAQKANRKKVLRQISRVENNLSEPFNAAAPKQNILDRMAFYKVKGVSIAVVENYKIVWAKAYGWADEGKKRKLTTSTVFKPGSISKSLNAVGVLRLAQNNKVNLYKDINTYLTSWKFPYDSVAKGKKITLANLLSHTAGLSVYGGFPGYKSNAALPTIPQILDGVAPANTPAVHSLFEPGVKFEYSGGGTIISQLIITDVTHKTYEQFMYDSVLKPLGMKNSFYTAAAPNKNNLKKLATGYTKEGIPVTATFNVYPEQAPLGLWTNPSEICKYLIEMQLAYKGESAKLLNKEMAHLHLTPYIDASATMGAFIGDRNGEKYFFHDAGNEGFRGLFYGSVEGGNGVAIFVNSDEGNIILELLFSVASVYKWKGF